MSYGRERADAAGRLTNGVIRIGLLRAHRSKLIAHFEFDAIFFTMASTSLRSLSLRLVA
jgi:hypothetical protein